jgi:NADH-quinone oxidoreductase subunit I
MGRLVLVREDCNWMGVFKDIKNLLIGMRITSKHLGRHAVTVQYPEQRDNIPDASRGVVVLLSDKETGELNCTACELCERVCPTAAIKIVAPRGEDKKKHLQSFEVNHSLCCFCGLCQDVCNFDALKMANKYEFSTLDKNDLVWDMNKLQEVGRDVPYTPRPKKKPVVKKSAEAAGLDAGTDRTEQPTEAATIEPRPASAEASPARTEAPAPDKPVEGGKVEPDGWADKPDDKPPQDDEGEV